MMQDIARLLDNNSMIELQKYRNPFRYAGVAYFFLFLGLSLLWDILVKKWLKKEDARAKASKYTLSLYRFLVEVRLSFYRLRGEDPLKSLAQGLSCLLAGIPNQLTYTVAGII